MSTQGIPTSNPNAGQDPERAERTRKQDGLMNAEEAESQKDLITRRKIKAACEEVWTTNSLASAFHKMRWKWNGQKLVGLL